METQKGTAVMTILSSYDAIFFEFLKEYFEKQMGKKLSNYAVLKLIIADLYDRVS